MGRMDDEFVSRHILQKMVYNEKVAQNAMVWETASPSE